MMPCVCAHNVYASRRGRDGGRGESESKAALLPCGRTNCSVYFSPTKHPFP